VRAEQVARDCAVPAAVSDHRDAPPPRAFGGEQRLQRLDKAPRCLDAMHTGRAARSVHGIE